ncbi:hypothetical protein [Nonomuraea sp. NPDC005650]|uniref:hypothetical protein n=1 Tax=Nonomuraea sp. NPDC005650 TaxID=3157045 RepID=UPI0033B5AB62
MLGKKVTDEAARGGGPGHKLAAGAYAPFPRAGHAVQSAEGATQDTDGSPWIYNPYWDKPEPPVPFQKAMGYEWVDPDQTDSDGNYIWGKDNSDD